MTKKLSKAQEEVLNLMRTGFEAHVVMHRAEASTFLSHKEAGYDTINIKYVTLHALRERELVRCIRRGAGGSTYVAV